MNDFLLSPAASGLTPDGTPSWLQHTFRSGDYILQYDGQGPELYGETGVYINGYILPRNNIFNDYAGNDQYRTVASLYMKFGSEFIRYIKGYFIIIIFSKGTIDVYFDHTGLFRAFYVIKSREIFISGSVRLLMKAGINLEFDDVSLRLQSLFHRVPLSYTVFRGISKTVCGDCFVIQKTGVTHGRHWKPEDLLEGNTAGKSHGVEDFAELFRENLNNFNRYLNPDNHYITLTGGKDSRTILVALLSNGIKPAGLTYGNEKSSDAVYSKLIADACRIEHLTVSPPGTREWFQAEAERIVATYNPEINIHRSHRFYAFSRAAGSCSGSTAFYTGYLGGEMLAGVFNDDLIFTDFQTQSWKAGYLSGLKERLSDYFHSPDPSIVGAIKERLEEMRSLDNTNPRLLKSFYGIFETGIPHHSQDVFLSGKYWRYPYPVFLDTEFLEMLFSSRYNFLEAAKRKPEPLRKYNLYTLNLRIQHLLFPEFDDIPFGKKGSYSTREYLRGPVYWYTLRGYRYLTDRSKYPPSFAYGSSYREFLYDGLTRVRASQSVIKDIYDIGRALMQLRQIPGLTSEKFFHRYSNIIMFHILDQKLKDEIQNSHFQK
jgi:hypothetical protein